MKLFKDWKTIFRHAKDGDWVAFTKPVVDRLAIWFYRFVETKGVKVMEEDWDYLIVLDACRYDVFKEHNWLDGELEKKISRGGASREWLRENFTDYYDNVVYVTANPFPWTIHQEKFYEVIPVFMDDEAQECGSTIPEAVCETALEAEEEHPDKRKIIHFMQPHQPFIGEPKLTMEETGSAVKMFTSPKGKEAYIGNLERALREVEKLVEELEGRIVVTADHGDCFGEKGTVSHKDGVHFKELVEVPWLVIEKGKRKKVRKELTDITV